MLPLLSDQHSLYVTSFFFNAAGARQYALPQTTCSRGKPLCAVGLVSALFACLVCLLYVLKRPPEDWMNTDHVASCAGCIPSSVLCEILQFMGVQRITICMYGKHYVTQCELPLY